MPLNESRNAIELLKHDHREVESLFAEFEAESSDERKLELGRKICIELTMHARVEEELFYPAAKEVLPQEREDLVAEAAVEHGSLKQLISEIDGSSASDELFDARFTVLKEYVQHHVREEEDQLMPAIERTDVDLDALGTEIAARKEVLKHEVERARSGNTRKITLPKLAGGESRRGSGSRAGTSTGRGSAAGKQPAARKQASAPSRQAAHKPRKSATAAKAPARGRAQARRARAARG